MKKCPSCANVYADDALACPFDDTELVSIADSALAPEEVDPNAPEGHKFFGQYNPLEAARYLKKFSDVEVRFQIEEVETESLSNKGIRKTPWIKIYVHREDEEKAARIVMEGVRV